MPLPLTLVALSVALAAAPELVATTTTATAASETPDIPTVAPPNLAEPPPGPGERRPLGSPDAPPVAPEPEPEEPGAPRIEIEMPSPPPPPTVAEPKFRKLEGDEQIPYGLGNALLGFAGIGLTTIGAIAESTLVAFGGLSLYLFGPTAMHWAHGNFEEGFASIALYAGAPLVGSAGAVIFGVPVAGDSDAAGPLALVGLIGGALMAVLVDAFVLAYVDEVEIVPSVAIDSNQSTFTIGGRF